VSYTIAYEKGAIVIKVPYDGKKETKDGLELSQSGNTNIIASTRGGIPVPAELLAIDPDAKISLSIYTKNDELKASKRKK